MALKYKRSLSIAVIGTILLVGCLPSYARLLAISGDSDAPALRSGDHVIANLAAYDLKIPFTKVSFLRHSNPDRGDYVAFINKSTGAWMVKRVVAVQGDTVEMIRGHLSINNRPHTYNVIQAGSPIPCATCVVKEERSEDDSIIVWFTPGRADNTFPKRTLRSDEYFVLGSFRDVSRDSRHFGPINREDILGSVRL